MRLAHWLGMVLIAVIIYHAQPLPVANSNPPDWKILIEPNKTEKDGWVELRSADLDGDGLPDAKLESRNGRGPLSTYFTSYRLQALPGTRFLRDAQPLPAGTKIRLSDLHRTPDVVDLGMIGGSLRFPNKSFEEFNGGPWWKKSQLALGVMTTRGDVVKMGYIYLKMSMPAEISVQSGRMEQVLPSIIEVKGN